MIDIPEEKTEARKKYEEYINKYMFVDFNEHIPKRVMLMSDIIQLFKKENSELKQQLKVLVGKVK